jgi:hypothetical protein
VNEVDVVGIGLGDLLRAFTLLRPDDEPSRSAIARMLGFGWQGSEFILKPNGPGMEVPRIQPDPDPEPEPEPSPAPPRKQREAPFHMPELPEPGTDAHPPSLMPLETQAGKDFEASLPKWYLEADPLPHSRDERRPHAPGIIPLLSPIRTRSIMVEALFTTRSDGPIDIAALTRLIAAAQPITILPRLRRRNLSAGVEVLVDRAEAMVPFLDDQNSLVERIRYLVGPARTRVLRFAGSPLNDDGAGPGGMRTWKPWAPPTPTRPVLLLTDLGICKGGEPHERANVAEWLEVVHVTHTAGCPLVALVPFPQQRWPEALQEVLPILQWDRQLSLRDVRQRLQKRRALSG